MVVPNNFKTKEIPAFIEPKLLLDCDIFVFISELENLISFL